LRGVGKRKPEVVDAVVPLLIVNMEAFLEVGFPGDDISDTKEVIKRQDFREDTKATVIVQILDKGDKVETRRSNFEEQ